MKKKMDKYIVQKTQQQGDTENSSEALDLEKPYEKMAGNRNKHTKDRSKFVRKS